MAVIDLDIDDKHENIELKDKHTLLEELQYTGSNSSSVKKLKHRHLLWVPAVPVKLPVVLAERAQKPF